MNDKHYTYYLIDPSTNEVFYVGMGKGKRIESHEYKVRRNQIPNNNKYLFNKIKKIISGKNNIIYKKILENVNQDEAARFEIEEIKRIGRSDLKLGTLCNLTDGGEGTAHLSEEVAERKREKLRYKKSDAHKRKLSLAHKGKIISLDTRIKLKNRKIQAWHHKEIKHHTDETKKVLSLLKKGKSWEDIYGIEESNKRRENLKNRHKLGLMKASTEILSEAQKRNWIIRKNKINEKATA
jgi:hypothetical protein